MSYTGTILEDLQNIVQDLLLSSARICVICRQRLGHNSAVGGYSRRRDLQCLQASPIRTSLLKTFENASTIEPRFSTFELDTAKGPAALRTVPPDSAGRPWPIPASNIPPQSGRRKSE